MRKVKLHSGASFSEAVTGDFYIPVFDWFENVFAAAKRLQNDTHQSKTGASVSWAGTSSIEHRENVLCVTDHGEWAPVKDWRQRLTSAY